MYHLIISAPARGSLVDRPSPTILRCHSVGTKRHCSALVAALAADGILSPLWGLRAADGVMGDVPAAGQRAQSKEGTVPALEDFGTYPACADDGQDLRRASLSCAVAPLTRC